MPIADMKRHEQYAKKKGSVSFPWLFKLIIFDKIQPLGDQVIQIRIENFSQPVTDDMNLRPVEIEESANAYRIIDTVAKA